MKEAKYSIGQVVYEVKEIRIARYTIEKIVHVTEEKGESIEYIAIDPFGKQSVVDESNTVETLEKAKEIAHEAKELIYKQINENIDKLVDSTFDEMAEKYKEKQKEMEK